MQIVLRINKNKYKDEQFGNFRPLRNDSYWIHFNFHKNVVYEVLLIYIGKYSHGSLLHYFSLFTGFLQVK